jgi:aminopeptidase N
MKRIIAVAMTAVIATFSHAQPSNAPAAASTVYRASDTRTNDLLHSKLKIKLDYEKAYAYGNVWLTLQPHFYATDSLRIDAKCMDIHKVELAEGNNMIPLKYRYDTAALFIRLNRTYKATEKYTVHIDYTVNTNELNAKVGKTALNKGLFFINADGKDRNKPTQVWTQGEPEATSCWFPTIDRPNQRSTQEMYITVPAQYTTLSNGVLSSSVTNSDKTRTDYWKMDMPHAPYLFFMAAGEFSIIKDSYKGKEVSYYVEKPYAAAARRVFGSTPEMMDYFSRITGVPYPWPKYAQVAVRDYVGGGMENTTASVFLENIQQDARQLADGNRYENLIAHELFHQWFGDYVTMESWSNLALSESFANYAEMLWQEHKYGKDKGDELNYNGLLAYVYSNNAKKELIRFYYGNKDDLFDGVIYNKGGRILNMLRVYLGDSAFFRSLNHYLVQNKMRSTEIHDLRIAFEEVTGKDLNWFFNQWFLNPGHPEIDISYKYDDAARQVSVMLKQLQPGNTFRLPMVIDIYEGGKKKSYPVEMTQKEQSFAFAYSSMPGLVNVDAGKALVWAKTDHRDLASYIYQYRYAGNYVDRREAIDAAADSSADPRAIALFQAALNDKFDGIVFHALMSIDMKNEALVRAVEPQLSGLAKNAKAANVRGKAISMLSSLNSKEYLALFKQAALDSSYDVSGEAVEALFKFDTAEGIRLAHLYAKGPIKGRLSEAVTGILMRAGNAEDFDFLADNFDKLPLSQSKMNMLRPFAEGLSKVDNTDRLKKGVDIIVRFRDAIPEPYNKQTDALINNVILKGLADKKSSQLAAVFNPETEAQVKYINDKMSYR